MNSVDRGEAVGLTLHIAKRIASEAKADDAMRRLEEAESAEDLRPLLSEVTVGMSTEKQEDYLLFLESNDFQAFKRRLMEAAEKSRVDQMSPSS